MDERIDLNIGHATAYAYAKSKGFTGTEEQFAALMANIGNTQKEIEDEIDAFVNITVLDAVQQVEAAQDTAVSAVGAAQTAAVSAVEAAGTTQTAAVNQAGADKLAAVNQAGAAQTAAVEAKGAAVLASIPADYTELQRQALAAYPTDTASGAIASFSDGAAMPVKALAVQIEPVQDLHGYDHPWPAGGEKNKLPTITSATTLNGVTWIPNADGTIKVNGTATENSVIDLGRTVLTLPAGTYTTNQSVAYQYDVNVFRLVNGSSVIHAEGGGAFTLTEEASIFVRFAVPSGRTVNNVIIQPMLESGSVRTSFAPYSNICPISGWTGTNIVVSPTQDAQNGHTYPVSWQSEAGTVYGGTLEYQGSGLWKLTNTMKRISLGSKSWTWAVSISQFMSVPEDSSIKAPPNNNTAANALCESYPVVPYNDQRDMSLFIPAANGNWRIRDSRFSGDSTGASALKASLAGVYLVYELAEPVEYTLTTEQVLTTLYGANNVWCDTGDVAVTYRADPTLFINKKIAAVMAAMS